jgi:hypothetical protein
MNMTPGFSGLNVNFDMIRCDVCGHVWTHTWTGVYIPPVERFPIECPECKAKAGYRMDIPKDTKEII